MADKEKTPTAGSPAMPSRGYSGCHSTTRCATQCERPDCADIPVVVLTALDLTREDRRRLAGANQILHKGDVSLRSIAERLHRLVAQG